jgi:hypothetical protein
MDADIAEEVAKDGEPLGGSMIATNIVAVTQVSTEHHHPIGPLAEGADHQLWRDAP